MKRYKNISKVGVFLITFVLLLSGVMMFSGNAHAWSVYVTWSPTNVHTGDTVTFHLNVKNTGSSNMKLTKVGIHFDWMASNYFYFASANFPIILKPGDSHDFYVNVPIPDNIQTHTSHAMDIRIEAADPSIFGWGFAYTRDVYGSIYVSKPIYKVYGYVKDSSGNDISDATVQIGSKTTHTNADGYYSIQIEKGTYTLSVQAEGYKPYDTTIVVSGNIKKDITLESEHTSILSSGSNGGTPGWVYGFVILLIIAIIIGVAIGIAARKKNKRESYVSEEIVPPPPAWQGEEKSESTEEANEERIPPPGVVKEPEIRYCPNCGHEIKPEWKICPYCGYKLKEE